jgi:hypothetical protein
MIVDSMTVIDHEIIFVVALCSSLLVSANDSRQIVGIESSNPSDRAVSISPPNARRRYGVVVHWLLWEVVVRHRSVVEREHVEEEQARVS